MKDNVKDLVFKNYFSERSDNYAAYRPSYPIDLVNALADLCAAQDRVLDCGCGTGQLSVLLADRFTDVIATDASSAQIAKAIQRDNITYRTALAEHSGLADESVDLITVAQAAHWLDLETFYPEVTRIVRPDGILALITYGVLHVEGDINALIQDFYHQTIGPYWPAERRHVETGYQSLTFPFTEIKMPAIIMEEYWPLESLMGYFNTWSAVKAATKVLGTNPVDQLRESLLPKWGDPMSQKKITWPISVRAGKIREASL